MLLFYSLDKNDRNRAWTKPEKIPLNFKSSVDHSYEFRCIFPHTVFIQCRTHECLRCHCDQVQTYQITSLTIFVEVTLFPRQHRKIINNSTYHSCKIWLLMVLGINSNLSYFRWFIEQGSVWSTVRSPVVVRKLPVTIKSNWYSDQRFHYPDIVAKIEYEPILKFDFVCAETYIGFILPFAYT